MWPAVVDYRRVHVFVGCIYVLCCEVERVKYLVSPPYGMDPLECQKGDHGWCKSEGDEKWHETSHDFEKTVAAERVYFSPTVASPLACFIRSAKSSFKCRTTSASGGSLALLTRRLKCLLVFCLNV